MRTRDAHDRRVARLDLTIHAREAVERWRDQRAHALASALESLDASARARIADAVPLIAQVAARCPTRPSPPPPREPRARQRSRPPPDGCRSGALSPGPRPAPADGPYAVPRDLPARPVDPARGPRLPAALRRSGHLLLQRRHLPGGPRQPCPLQPGEGRRRPGHRHRVRPRAPALQRSRAVRRGPPRPVAAPAGHRRQPARARRRDRRGHRTRDRRGDRACLLRTGPARLLRQPLHPRRARLGHAARRPARIARERELRCPDVWFAGLPPGRRRRHRGPRPGRQRRPRRAAGGRRRARGRVGRDSPALHRARRHERGPVDRARSRGRSSAVSWRRCGPSPAGPVCCSCSSS